MQIRARMSMSADGYVTTPGGWPTLTVGADIMAVMAGTTRTGAMASGASTGPRPSPASGHLQRQGQRATAQARLVAITRSASLSVLLGQRGASHAARFAQCHGRPPEP